jgi:hypothetical protein
MIYFLALLPATALTIAGYFVLYLAARSEGTLRSFGRYLGFWAFTLAGLIVLGAILAAARHRHYCPHFGMHERMHGPGPAEPGWDRARGTAPGEPGTPPAPAASPPSAPEPPPPR